MLNQNNLKNKYRMMTVVSAMIPVIFLLFRHSPTECIISVIYMYFIAPFILLPILGYKFKKAKRTGSDKKQKAPWTLNGKVYSFSELNKISFRNFAIIMVSLFTLPLFNKLYLPMAQQLIIAGPFLLIHVFFFVKGEPLSVLKSFTTLPDNSNLGQYKKSSLGDVFANSDSLIDSPAARLTSARAAQYGGIYAGHRD